jgi:hypothetical protein
LPVSFDTAHFHFSGIQDAFSANKMFFWPKILTMYEHSETKDKRANNWPGNDAQTKFGEIQSFQRNVEGWHCRRTSVRHSSWRAIAQRLQGVLWLSNRYRSYDLSKFPHAKPKLEKFQKLMLICRVECEHEPTEGRT